MGAAEGGALAVEHGAAAEPGGGIGRDRFIGGGDQAVWVPIGVSMSNESACRGMCRRADDGVKFFWREEGVKSAGPAAKPSG